MSDGLDQERKAVRQCAQSLARVASLIEHAVCLDLHPSLDWEQLLRFVNEEMLLGCDNAMWNDPADQLAALTHVTEGLKRQVKEAAS